MCDEFGRPTSCGGSQHETGRRCFTDGLLDRWNGDVKAVPSIAEAIRHQCGLKGARVGEADNPGPSNSDSELEDDHRNVVRVDPFVPPDVVEALERDLCEPAMVPADPNVEVWRQCNEDSGSGLVPTLLDDVEQDLAVPSTEIDMTVGDSLQGVSVPQDVIHALEHDLCGHRCGSRSPLVTVTPADPNARARVLGVADVDNLSSDSFTLPASSGAVREAQGFRRLVLVSGARSDAVPIDFRSGNRFAAVADRDGEANIPGLHGRRVVLVPQDSDGTPQSIQDVRTENASSVGRPEEFNFESDEHGEKHSEADTESLPGDGASVV